MHENKNWQRLEAVIRWANMSANYFAHHIGLSRGENLYQIKRGNNGISLNLADRIVKHFPALNKLWLLTGEGEMLVETGRPHCEVPFYRVDVERSIGDVELLEAECKLALPNSVQCDLAMVYMNDAMGRQVPNGTIVFLKEMPLAAVIPGKEYVVCGERLTTLRVVRKASHEGVLRLVAGDKKNFDDLEVAVDEIQRLYVVCAKLTIN